MCKVIFGRVSQLKIPHLPRPPVFSGAFSETPNAPPQLLYPVDAAPAFSLNGVSLAGFKLTPAARALHAAIWESCNEYPELYNAYWQETAHLCILEFFQVTIKNIIMNSGKILLGVLAGVAAGATLGILLAPDKGSTTRHKITKKGNDYVDGLNEKFNDFIDSMTRKFEKMKDEAARLAENGKAKVEEVEVKVASATNRNPLPLN